MDNADDSFNELMKNFQSELPGLEAQIAADLSALPILRRQSTARAFFPHPREGFYAFAFCSSRDGKRDFGKCSALHDKQP